MAKIRYKKPQVPKFKRVINAFQRVRQIMAEEVEAFAEEEKDDFKDRIERQDFPSFDATPLSPAYSRWKKKQGLDPRVMIATGHYHRSIRVFRRKDGKHKALYYIGHHKRARARDHKGQVVPIFLNLLAAVHEKGSLKMNIPARPHWGPHLKRMGVNAVERRQAIRVRIRKRLAKRLGTLA